jgi:hypothetical protein
MRNLCRRERENPMIALYVRISSCLVGCPYDSIATGCPHRCPTNCECHECSAVTMTPSIISWGGDIPAAVSERNKLISGDIDNYLGNFKPSVREISAGLANIFRLSRPIIEQELTEENACFATRTKREFVKTYRQH